MKMDPKPSFLPTWSLIQTANLYGIPYLQRWGLQGASLSSSSLKVLIIYVSVFRSWQLLRHGMAGEIRELKFPRLKVTKVENHWSAVCQQSIPSNKMVLFLHRATHQLKPQVSSFHQAAVDIWWLPHMWEVLEWSFVHFVWLHLDHSASPFGSVGNFFASQLKGQK